MDDVDILRMWLEMLGVERRKATKNAYWKMMIYFKTLFCNASKEENNTCIFSAVKMSVECD